VRDAANGDDLESAAGSSGQRPSTPDSLVADDGSSDVTLIGDTILTPDSETDENLKQEPIEDADAISIASKKELRVRNGTIHDTIDESSLSATDQEALTNSRKSENNNKRDSMELDNPLQPPSRPPPVPPRPPATSTRPQLIVPPEQKLLKETEDAARQQDVHEVMDKILTKMQCAIKPDSIDAEEDRITQIREYATPIHIVSTLLTDVRAAYSTSIPSGHIWTASGKIVVN
jgi:hypothetical protein